MFAIDLRWLWRREIATVSVDEVSAGIKLGGVPKASTQNGALYLIWRARIGRGSCRQETQYALNVQSRALIREGREVRRRCRHVGRCGIAEGVEVRRKWRALAFKYAHRNERRKFESLATVSAVQGTAKVKWKWKWRRRVITLMMEAGSEGEAGTR
jgi:hypothetical protein